MPLKTYPFDASEYLDNWESYSTLLDDALASGNPEFVLHVFGVIARARGMTSIAEEAGISRKELYEAMKDDTSPDIVTLRKVAAAIAAKHAAEPRKSDDSPQQAAE